MSAKEKLEQVLEHLINEEGEKASDLLHDVFVEKARSIYEGLIEEDEAVEEEVEDVEEAIAGDVADDFVDDVQANSDEIESEEVFSEDDLEDEEGDEMVEPEMDAEPEGGEEAVEDAFMNVEDALDELKREFAAMMGDEGAEDMGMEEPTDDEEMGAMVDAEEELMMSADNNQDNDEELEEDYEDLEEGHDMATAPEPQKTEGSDAKHKTSPTAGANPMDSGGRSAVKMKDGGEGDHGTSGVSEDNAGNVNTVPGKADGEGGSAAPSAQETEGSDAKNKKSPLGS